MVGCWRVAEKERKQVPEEQRVAVTVLLIDLLEQRDEFGRRKWSQERLGAKLGGLSQETIRRALVPSGVAPAVRDGLLAFLETDVAGLLQRRNSLMHRGIPLPVDAMVERYDSRERAIQTHMRYREHPEPIIRAAADAVAVALDANEDPGERWWYEQIDAELKRGRRPGPRLGERELTDDNEPPPRPRQRFEVREGQASEDVDKTLAEAAAALGEKAEEDRGERPSSVAKTKRAHKSRH